MKNGRVYLTIREFAVEVGRSESFIRNAIRNQKLPFERIGNQYLIRNGEVRKFQARPITVSRKEAGVY